MQRNVGGGSSDRERDRWGPGRRMRERHVEVSPERARGEGSVVDPHGPGF